VSGLANLRYIFLLLAVVLLLSACEKEHDDVVYELEYTNPFDADNPETHGNPYNLTTHKDSAEMVLILAGEFQMDDSFDEGIPYARPVHTVYLDAFYIDRYEVTNSQYAAFLNSYGKNIDDSGHKLMGIDTRGCLIEQVGGIYKARSGYEDHPAIMLSWYGANAYAEFYGVRLPTEVEWEKAARGGLVGKRYPGGNGITHNDANYSGTGGKDIWSGEDVWDRTSPVGSFAPNDYGLYDMAGNMWEWCADWYDDRYYSSSPKNNPTGPSNGVSRVLRGGSWHSEANDLRCARRFSIIPKPTYDFVGFRCAE